MMLSTIIQTLVHITIQEQSMLVHVKHTTLTFLVHIAFQRDPEEPKKLQ